MKHISSLQIPSVRHHYKIPSWCEAHFTNPPQHGKLNLANLPSPVYQLGDASFLFGKDLNINLYIKRDDATGAVELGGNKVRKLEFLLAEALHESLDSVVTIGGQQSNHCRATAAACRMVGLEPHLILRTTTKDMNENTDLGVVGNLLIDRMVGSTIYTCTAGEYGRIGSNELVARVCAHLQESGKRPYPIPVGGSNGLGSWGYINAVDELLHQLNDDAADEMSPARIDHIVFACGSGGTAAGIALGVALADARLLNSKGQKPKVHAVGVCDDPNYFYQYVAKIACEMGLILPHGYSNAEEFVRQHMIVHQGKGQGYAQSTNEELAFVAEFARRTGIVLDPVYSGKALFNFLKIVKENEEEYKESNVLFWHTGGALGMYDKAEELFSHLITDSKCIRLNVYGMSKLLRDQSDH